VTDPGCTCPVCGGATRLFDVVDFNTECLRRPVALSGMPVYYRKCETCGFLFAPDMAGWSEAQFAQYVYNDGYAAVDPDYVYARPASNAKSLLSMFPKPGPIAHLDYGGGSGVLSAHLREAGWDSDSYDPIASRGQPPQRSYDLITAYEVFEHVGDPQGLMQTLRALMKPKALLLFSTLVCDGEIADGGRLTWWYAAPRNGHISLFSSKSLAVLGRQYRLKLGSFNKNLHLYYDELPAWAVQLRRP
jgi:SAM-dependent methyltransferase